MLPSLAALRRLSLCPSINDGYPEAVPMRELIRAKECDICTHKMGDRSNGNVVWPVNGDMYCTTHCNHIHHKTCLYQTRTTDEGRLLCPDCRADITYMLQILSDEYDLGEVFVRAAFGDDNDRVRYLLSQKGVYVDYVMPVSEETNQMQISNETALMTASKEGRPEIVQTLLEFRADVNLTANFTGYDIGGDNGEYEMSALTLVCENLNVDIVKLLLAVDNVKINNPDPTPLVVACLTSTNVDEMYVGCDRHKIVKMLLNKGADVNIPEKNGVTPLMAACNYLHGPIVDLLLSVQDINIEAVNEDGDTALLCTYQVLDLDDPDAHLGTVDALLTNGANVNVHAKNGDTPLINACFFGYDKIVKRLLEVKDIEIDAKNEDLETALVVASAKNRVAIVRQLLERNADVNAARTKFQDRDENFALYEAIRNGHLEVITELVRAGARMTQTTVYNILNDSDVDPRSAWITILNAQAKRANDASDGRPKTRSRTARQ